MIQNCINRLKMIFVSFRTSLNTIRYKALLFSGSNVPVRRPFLRQCSNKKRSEKRLLVRWTVEKVHYQRSQTFANYFSNMTPSKRLNIKCKTWTRNAWTNRVNFIKCSSSNRKKHKKKHVHMCDVQLSTLTHTHASKV